jgi:glutathione S-transferase
MSYTLVSSERSPFGRICRMLMVQHQIPFEFKILNFVDDKEDAIELSKLTPINKVPLLIVNGDQKIFDSRVIANFLMLKHKIKALTVEEENMVSCAYTCLDVGVTMFLMKRDGYDMTSDGFFLRRNRERIPKSLAYMESWASQLNPENPGDWNYASMSLFTFLYWAEKRAGVVKLSEMPKYASFFEKFSQAPGVRETDFK